MQSINENSEDLLKLYTLSEMAYESHLKDFVASVEELYPDGWYSSTDYKEKIAILSEAIKTNSLIVNTSMYQQIKEKKYIK